MSLNTRRVSAVILKGVELRPGDRVKVKPIHPEVLSDVPLAGTIGVIESFEQYAENRVHVVVVLDDEPVPSQVSGERFLFTLDEIEPIPT